MTAALDHVLRHNAWATKTLLEHCASLGTEALDLQARGTYGTLYRTLQHIVGAEQWYVSLLTDEVLGSRIRKTEGHSLDELITVATMTGPRAIVRTDHRRHRSRAARPPCERASRARDDHPRRKRPTHAEDRRVDLWSCEGHLQHRRRLRWR